MRKFVAVYGLKQGLVPQVTSCSKVLSTLMMHKDRLEFKVFESEIEAEKFIHPRRLEYFNIFDKHNSSHLVADQPNHQNTEHKVFTTSVQNKEQEEPPHNNPSSPKEKPVQNKHNNINKQIAESIAFLKKGSNETFERILKIQGNQRYYNPSTPLCKVVRANEHCGLIGSYVMENGRVGIGYLVVTKQGKVVFQKSLSLGKNRTEMESSTLSLIYCLLDCSFNSIRKFKIFTSCQELKNIYGKEDPGGDENLESLCHSIMRSFEHIEFHIVKEDKNKTAIELARKGAKMKYLGD